MASNEFKLLLVEDNKDEAYLFELLLKKVIPQAKVVHLTNGEAAISYLDKICDGKLEKCFVIMDLNLPYLSGREVVKRLDECTKKRDIALVVFSGSENPKDKEFCLSHNVTRYFVKPWHIDEYGKLLRGPILEAFKNFYPNYTELK